MTVRLQFSLTPAAVQVLDGGMFNFLFVGNALEYASDDATPTVAVVNGWTGNPGDIIDSKVVIVNSRNEVDFEEPSTPVVMTNQRLLVIVLMCQVPLRVPGWHKVRVFAGDHLAIEYPLRLRRSKLSAAEAQRQRPST